MSFATMLDTTCDIEQDVDVADGQGGYTTTQSTIHANVPCRFASLDKKLEITAYNKTAVFPDYFVFMEYLAIDETMRIKWEGRTFEINHIRDWSHQNRMLKIAVTEIKRNE